MKLIVGLGNPGESYKNTRHNAGYMFIDEIFRKKISNLKILKSDEFMNDSGKFVVKKIKELKLTPDDLYIVHDDLDIPFGKYKIQFGRGPKDHNGILDIEDKLGSKDFWRVRIGVDNRPLDNRPLGEVYTLENFTVDELNALESILKEVCKKLVDLSTNSN